MNAPKDELIVRRLKLKEWLLLEEARERISKAAEVKDYSGISAAVSAYISAACDIKDWTAKPWFETMLAFQKVYMANMPTISFPILKVSSLRIQYFLLSLPIAYTFLESEFFIKRIVLLY